MDSDLPLDVPATLWRKRRLIVALTVVGAVAALIASYLQSPTYAASVQVWIKPTNLQPTGSINPTATIDLTNEASLITSEAVAAGAAEELGSTSATVIGATQVELPKAGQVLTIRYRSSEPAAAAEGASAVAGSYLAFRGLDAENRLDDAVELANGSMDGLRQRLSEVARTASESKPGSPAAIAAEIQMAQINGQITILENQVAQLTMASVDPGQVVTPAKVPAQSTSADHLKDGIRGALVGLAIAIAAALTGEGIRRARRRAA